MDQFKPYISLIRPNYHASFVEVILGILFVFPISVLPLTIIFLKMLILFFSFVLFYGGIYTLNDVVDMEDDKKDDRKKLRALPSGKVSIRNGLTFALFQLIAGFFLALFLLDSNIAKIFLLFLIINLLYTFIFKKIAYVELIVNCLTHPLRLVLGASLLGASISTVFLVTYFFFISGFGLKIRQIMMENKGEVSRPSLRHYSASRIKMMKLLSLFLLIAFAAFDKKTSVGWYLFLEFVYVTIVFNLSSFEMFDKLFRQGYISKQGQ